MNNYLVQYMTNVAGYNHARKERKGWGKEDVGGEARGLWWWRGGRGGRGREGKRECGGEGEGGKEGRGKATEKHSDRPELLILR